MAHYKKLVGAKVYLSPMSLEDAEKIAQWENDLAVTLLLGDEAYEPMSLEKAQEVIGEAIKNQRHVFSIVDLASDTLIGRGLLFSIDAVNRSAMLGILIGDKAYWSQGYGQDAMKLLLDYGFNLLNLNSIMLGVFDFNQRGIACYRKVGFKEIGRRRQARIIAGKKYDVVLMDILADEYQSVYVRSLME